MTTPSVPRCGRMDPHEPHIFTTTQLRYPRSAEYRNYHCPGVVIHEGGARCRICGDVVCRCEAELAEARNEEWWAGGDA